MKDRGVAQMNVTESRISPHLVYSEPGFTSLVMGLRLPDIQPISEIFFTLVKSRQRSSAHGWVRLSFSRLAWLLCVVLWVCFSVSASAQTPLVNDGVVSGSISSPGEADEFTFEANAGEVVHIRVIDSGGTAFFSPKISLYNPDDTLEATDDYGDEVALDCYPSTAYGVCNLNQTGTYRLVVEDHLNDEIGSYEIRFLQVLQSNENGYLVNDGVVRGELSYGDIDSFVFEANAGEAVHIRAVDSSGTAFFGPKIWLYNPDGTREAIAGHGTTYDEVAIDCYPSTAYGVCNLNQTGTYRLVVEDHGNDVSGSYEIRFLQVLQSNENGYLVNDGVVRGELTHGDIDSFVFEANAGESAHIRVIDADGTTFFGPKIWLYNPDGTREAIEGNGYEHDEVVLDCYPSTAYGICNLNQTGTYRLVVEGYRNDVSGNYEITFDGPPQPTSDDGDVGIEIDKNFRIFYSPGKPISYSFILSNRGFSDVSGASFRHSIPKAIQSLEWSCRSLTSVVCLPSQGSERDIEINVDFPARGTVEIRVAGTVGSEEVDTIYGSAWLDYGPDPIHSNNSVNFSFHNSLSPMLGRGGDESWIHEPISLIRNNDESIVLSWPTVVLVHGLQGNAVKSTDLWTSFTKPNQAGSLLVAQTTHVNVVQVYWGAAMQCLDAFSVAFPNASCYKDAKMHVSNAGKKLASELSEALGPGYQNKIHLIGHSLGSGVIAYAARDLLVRYDELHDMQLTVLDQPHNIERIPGFSFINADAHRFDLDFMATVLRDVSPQRYKIDNYFAFSNDLFRDGAGVGAEIDGASTYNHAELIDPHEVAKIIGEDLLVGDNDHSGVHQWYRLSISPFTPFPSGPGVPNAEAVCNAENWNLENDELKEHVTDVLVPPCETGWKNSNIYSAGFPHVNAPAYQTPIISPISGFSDPFDQGCSFSQSAEGFLGGSCILAGAQVMQSASTQEVGHAVPFGTAKIDIPGGAKYLLFEYQFSNMLVGDYAAVLIDGQLVWQMSGSNIPSGEWESAGPIPVSGFSGESLLMIVMYTSATDSALFNWQNMQFILGDSIFKDGYE